MRKNTKMILADDVRIFSNGMDELRIRKGIWNYEEATIILSTLPEKLKKLVIDLLYKLDEGKAVDIEQTLSEGQLSDEEKEYCNDIFSTLHSQDYLHYEEEKKVKLLLNDIIGGVVVNQFREGMGSLRPVLFFSDSPFIKESTLMLAKEIELPITVMSEKEFSLISNADLTTKYDGLETRKAIDELSKYIDPYCCIVGSLERPHIIFLRNLNRLLINQSKPLSLSILDGPFTSLLTVKPPETGCFECFELRQLARMEDMSVYHNFVAHVRKKPVTKNKSHASPLLLSMTSSALFESYLISAVGKAKFAGRVFNTYLPIMEMQVQDLLRVPFCPACGFIAEAQMDEMYVSSKKLIEKIKERVVISR